MEGFSYNNIFETKGIEYLAIIAFFALLIPFWYILNRKVNITHRIKEAWSTLTASILQIPQGVYHCKNHTWAFLEKSGVAAVGLDELLLHITGEVKFSHLKNAGEVINRGEPLIEIIKDDKMLTLFSPISGQIVNTNDLLREDPELLNQDPYGKGWIYKIKPLNWKSETGSYYLADEAISWSKTEIERVKDFIAESVRKYSPDQQLILQDGGELQKNTLNEMSPEVWNDFQKEFLEFK